MLTRQAVISLFFRQTSNLHDVQQPDDRQRDKQDAVIQREADEVSGEGGNQTDLMILTHDTKEGAMNKALTAMQALPTVLAPIVKLRKEELA